jgi:elongation factor P--(R)-beta-lysine ligase
MCHEGNNLPITWFPTAPLKNLELRATVLAKVRNFFARKNVLEIETPLLAACSVTNPHLVSFEVKHSYLQTSPEFAMKRIIAAFKRDIYQICKAFRDEESGRRHHREFTLLEWYRVGFDHHQLMDEMDELLQEIMGTKAAARFTYEDIFVQELNLHPHHCSIEEMIAVVSRKKLNLNLELFADQSLADRDFWLQLLFSHCIEPKLGLIQPVFIYDFPASQAALAKISSSDQKVAERFEVYYRGIELANGFHELTDAREQRARFEVELTRRQELSLPALALDENFLASVDLLPSCAGVAVGVDRILLILAGAKSLREVISFVGNE